jgi:replicative DNA helicase
MRERQETALHSEAAEEGLVGALMLDQSGDLFEAIQPISERDFSILRNRLLFTAVERLFKSGAPWDARAVFEALVDPTERAAEHIQECVEYAQEYRVNAKRLAGQLRDLSKRRAIRAAAEDLIELTALRSETLESLAERASRITSEIARGQTRKAPRVLGELMVARTQHYEDVAEGRVETGWPCSIPEINRALMGGFKPGKLYFVGARPGVGKSSFTAQVMMDLARSGKPGLFLSQEMPADEVADRAVANVARVDIGRLMTGRMDNEDWERLSEVADKVHDLPAWVDDQGALTIADIRHKVRAIPSLKVLVVDYLQLCSKTQGSSASNRNSEIEEISRGLKALSMELGLAVIVLSQLNREVEKRPGKKPQLSDLRDSGSIEQDADGVFLLWPVREFEGGGKLVGLHLAKNRGGPTGGDIALDFRGATQRWTQSTEAIHEPQEAQKQTRGFGT